MNIKTLTQLMTAISGTSCLLLGTVDAKAASIYLNNTNITVEVGPGTSPGTFNNTFANGNTIEKVIDAPSADAAEFHNQTTHIWFTASSVGGGLELLFDFGQEYDLTTLHFWNFTGENFDVDNIDFTFLNSDNTQVGQLSVTPALGSSGGILAEDIPLAAPLNVQFVTAFLSGTNRQVDFQNLGFTGEISEPRSVPESSNILGLIFVAGVSVFTGIKCQKKEEIKTEQET
ncbi:MAG: hypothetical protein WBM32_12290 [Crocosphaera sp.]|jgi:hypothetical protein